MKELIKKHKTKFMIIICILFGGIIGVSADEITTIFDSEEVSYSNENMDATNVQDAIDELYEQIPKTAATTIAKLNTTVVTSGAGLYADSVEDGRYIYKGANPNNYICLGDLANGTCPTESLYRIISIESDGTLKVIKNTSIGNIGYDNSQSRSATYCNYAQYGCNVWGSSSTMYKNGSVITAMPRQYNESNTYALPTAVATLNTSLNGLGFYNNLSSKIKNLIVYHYFNNGPLAYVSGQSIATDVNQEAAYKWKGNVGLMNATDYVRASTNSTCTSLYSYTQQTCYKNSNTYNWLFLGSDEWTLSPYSDSAASFVWHVGSGGIMTSGNVNNGRADLAYVVRPVFYLTSSISLSGKGTNNSEVYIIS